MTTYANPAERSYTHEITGGFCVQCGETEEWLIANGWNAVRTAEPVSADTPAGTQVTLGSKPGIVAGTLTGDHRWRNHQLYFQYATPQGSTRWAAFLLVA